MSRYYDDRVQVEAPPRPDYDRMWSEIEREASRRRSASLQLNPSPGARRKWIPAAVVFACFMAAAVPVFAGVTLNWDSLYGGRSVTSALNNGMGQRYDMEATSKGVTMSLKGVVTDGEKMKLLVTFDAGSATKPEPDEFMELERMVIKDGTGAEASVNGYLKYDESSGKLLGIYEAKDLLQSSKKNLTLEAGGLVSYKTVDKPLSKVPEAGEALSTGEAQYPEIRIKSVTESKDSLSVRYIVTPRDPSDQGHGGPHLTIHAGSVSSQGKVTQHPPDNDGIVMEQIFSNMTLKEWKASELHFNYMKESQRTEGIWSFQFKADGRKASEAIYSQPLQANAEFEQKSGVKLDALTVTPLEIVIGIKDERAMEDRSPQGDVIYRDVRLLVGDQEITGSYTIKGDDPKNYKHVFAFESPEWYKDWSKVPMKLILQDASVVKRDTAKNWIILDRPKPEKKFIDMKLESFTVHFTYYMDGKDLMIESESDDASFKGISQSTLRVDGKTLFPEMSPRGPEAQSKNIERYPDFTMKAAVELNPGFYSYRDPSRSLEFMLR